MMVGRDVQFAVDKAPCKPGETILEVDGLSRAQQGAQEQRRAAASRFKVHAGEIVCVAGIEGNGQTELIYGLDRPGESHRRHGQAQRQGHHPRPHP